MTSCQENAGLQMTLCKQRQQRRSKEPDALGGCAAHVSVRILFSAGSLTALGPDDPEEIPCVVDAMTDLRRMILVLPDGECSDWAGLPGIGGAVLRMDAPTATESLSVNREMWQESGARLVLERPQCALVIRTGDRRR